MSAFYLNKWHCKCLLLKKRSNRIFTAEVPVWPHASKWHACYLRPDPRAVSLWLASPCSGFPMQQCDFLFAFSRTSPYMQRYPVSFCFMSQIDRRGPPAPTATDQRFCIRVHVRRYCETEACEADAMPSPARERARPWPRRKWRKWGRQGEVQWPRGRGQRAIKPLHLRPSRSTLSCFGACQGRTHTSAIKKPSGQPVWNAENEGLRMWWDKDRVPHFTPIKLKGDAAVGPVL
jgi:hypothetical protein